MKNILLPTDFSDNSWNAINYALQLYKDEACTFYLLNVYQPIFFNMEYVLTNPAQFGLGDVMRYASQEGLERLRTRILHEFQENSNHKFETVARFDTLIYSIRELIDEHLIDIIIMGTKGATGAKEILFGSNTVHVFKDIKCPILAIPSNYEYEAPHEILFPTDLEVNFNNSNLTILKEIAVAHDSRVNAMHVSTGYDLTEEQQNAKLHLESIFSGIPYIFHNVETMEITDAINKFQIKHKINLLVMVNNKHSFFENLFFKNTINQIGFYLNVPFLVIPSINSIKS